MKLSVNKLGEYMTATPSRRKQIIKDQKRPSTFKVARYTDAREAIVNYLSSNMTDEATAGDKIEELITSGGHSDFQMQDRVLSADAIENFLDVSDEINLDGVTVEAGERFSEEALEIDDVSITMRPDALLKDEKTGEIVGCLKLHFPKSHPLDEKGCEYVATAMRHHLTENISTPSAVIPSKCYVVDVSTGKVRTAPKAYKRRMNDITAACEEISARWPRMTI